MNRILGGTGAAVAAKLLTGFAVVAFAAAGAGGAMEASISGSLNPADWGQQVKQQVATCKAALTAGQHGIGQCVSAFAKQHGDLVSDSHENSGARTDHSNGNGKNKGNNGHGQGQDNGQPSDKAHGKPSTVPSH
jgi:hypothetical protein